MSDPDPATLAEDLREANRRADTAEATAENLQVRVERLEKVLREVEYGDVTIRFAPGLKVYAVRSCPKCDGIDPADDRRWDFKGDNGHRPGCPLAAALAGNP